MSDVFDYNGNITYFNVSYDDSFMTVNDKKLYCLDSSSMQKLVNFTDDSWFEYQPESDMKFYFNGEVKTITRYGKVRMLGSKTQNHAVFMFQEESNGKRNIYLNLINTETGEPLHWCPCIKRDFNDYEVMGAVSTTPNTHVFILGYDERFILFFSSLYTRQSDQKDYQIICSDFEHFMWSNYDNTDAVRYHFAAMDGTFFDSYETMQFVKPVISTNIPFKALMCNGFAGNNDSYVSVGDVLNSVQDTSKKTAKITHKNVDYIKYATQNKASLTLWFRIYGGSNGI